MLLSSHVNNYVSLLSFVHLLLNADRNRLRINQPRENSPHHSAKMYSPSVAFNCAPSGKGYQRNMMPSSSPSVSSSRTCVRSRSARNNFLVQDLETCCASSNDFTCMSEKCEDMISEAMSQCEFSEDMIDM